MEELGFQGLGEKEVDRGRRGGDRRREGDGVERRRPRRTLTETEGDGVEGRRTVARRRREEIRGAEREGGRENGGRGSLDGARVPGC